MSFQDPTLSEANVFPTSKVRAFDLLLLTVGN
jgi:hypothetical protein